MEKSLSLDKSPCPVSRPPSASFWKVSSKNYFITGRGGGKQWLFWEKKVLFSLRAKEKRLMVSPNPAGSVLQYPAWSINFIGIFRRKKYFWSQPCQLFQHELTKMFKEIYSIWLVPYFPTLSNAANRSITLLLFYLAAAILNATLVDSANSYVPRLYHNVMNITINKMLSLENFRRHGATARFGLHVVSI